MWSLFTYSGYFSCLMVERFSHFAIFKTDLAGNLRLIINMKLNTYYWTLFRPVCKVKSLSKRRRSKDIYVFFVRFGSSFAQKYVPPRARHPPLLSHENFPTLRWHPPGTWHFAFRQVIMLFLNIATTIIIVRIQPI